jgi:hypothetical protein
MTSTLKVRAATGLKCPMKGAHRSYITDSAFVEVPDNAHYRKLLLDGSLTEDPIPAAASSMPGTEDAADGKEVSHVE